MTDRIAVLASVALLGVATLSGAASGAVVPKRPPVRLRSWAPIGSGWWMRVEKVRANLRPAFYGAQPTKYGVYVVTVSLRYLRKGSANTESVFESMQLQGRRAGYANAVACRGAWRRVGGFVRVESGGTVTGDVCFQDLRKDAPTMRLFVTDLADVGVIGKPVPRVEFALR